MATLAVLAASSPVLAANPKSCAPLLDHRVTKLQGGVQNLCEYQGKVLLLVNTASYCGFTGQYKGLEKLYRRYRDHGLLVLGFPSNDFGAQEPGNNKEIAAFCERTYQVQFPMFEKSNVTGANSNPVFRELSALGKEAPRWNFHKYLVDRSGTRVATFESTVTPDDPRLAEQIERMLKE